MTAAPATVSFPALGTTASLLVTEPAALAEARRVLERELAAVDAACSRFRTDSELSAVNAADGTSVEVGPVFAEALEVALRAAEATDGAVDPTVGTAVIALGYDRTYAQVSAGGPGPVRIAPRRADWRAVDWDRRTHRVRVPSGIALDFGATAKALAADRAAAAAAEAVGCGVLVNLGGDLGAAGPAPAGGWRIAVRDHHADTAPAGPTVAITGGGLATSGTTARTWRRGGRVLHHIVVPATGDAAPPVWRTVSVLAASCVEANTASTAAVVLGEPALDALERAGLPARLVGRDGGVVTLGGWPADPERVPR